MLRPDPDRTRNSLVGQGGGLSPGGGPHLRMGPALTFAEDGGEMERFRLKPCLMLRIVQDLNRGRPNEGAYAVLLVVQVPVGGLFGIR